MSPPAKSFRDELPPSVNFAPDDDEIIRLYLLPRVRGQPDLIPGLIIDDDSAANTQPWNLFRRHGLTDKVPAFFFVHTKEARPGARPIRVCQGGWAWKSQKRHSEDEGHVLVLEDGEKIKWERHNLNFNMGSGSVGWVMHEYSIPASPSHRLCRISLSGHGQKRMRSSDDCLAGEPATQRRRVDEHDSGSSSGSASWTKHASEDRQEPIHLTSDADITALVEELTDADAQPYFMTPAMEQPADQEPRAAQTSEYEESAAMTEPRLQPDVVMQEQQVDQEPSMFFDGMSYTDLLLQGVMAPSSCSVPNASDMDTGMLQGVLDWEGFRFVY